MAVVVIATEFSECGYGEVLQDGWNAVLGLHSCVYLIGPTIVSDKLFAVHMCPE